MKITDKHVSDEQLNQLIDWFSIFPDAEEFEYGLLESLLELKQRRAEDRHREANG